MRLLPCNHLFVDGFGGMGDAIVCGHCGLDHYPEVITIAATLALAQGRIIKTDHPQWELYANWARAARALRRANQEAKS